MSLTNFFNAKAKFNADRDCITFHRRDTDRILSGSNPMLAEMSDQIIVRYLEKIRRYGLRKSHFYWDFLSIVFFPRPLNGGPDSLRLHIDETEFCVGAMVDWLR